MAADRLNRRKFLGCSAAAGWALSQGRPIDAAPAGPPVRLGLIGLGNRGTSLLRTALELPNATIAALCDAEPRHAARGQGIVEKATTRRPDAVDDPARLLERPDVEAVLVALPCDLHAAVVLQALAAGKHVYVEKPLAPTLAECDRLVAAEAEHPGRVVHVGFQRRSNPRYAEGVDLLRRGDLGPLIEARGTWVSSNGPVRGHGGWMGRRERSGDWMVEQAVHVWDVCHWLKGDLPARAYGHGRRDLFRDADPGRDVTDAYSVMLEWADGFSLSFVQSWADPADDAFTGVGLKVVGEEGGFDFATGTATFRDRSRPRLSIHPGNLPETRFALAAFLDAVRGEGTEPTPVSLDEAREATRTGLMVRRAVDERRVVAREDVVAGT